MPTIEREPEREKRKDLKDVWEERLRAGEKKLRESGAKIEPRTGELTGKWGEWIRFFEGDQWPAGMGGRSRRFDRITSNIAKANIDSLRPQLYFQNPRVKATVSNPDLAPQPVPGLDPATGQPYIRIPAGTPVATVGGQVVPASEQAELFEAIDNYYLDEMRCKPITRRVINDALILPFGVSKLEWVVEFVTDDVTEPDGTVRKVERVSYQYPRYSRVKPWCFIWDPELDEFDLNLAAWVAEIQYLSKDEIEAIPNIKVDWNQIAPEYTYSVDYDVTPSEVWKPRKEAWDRYKTYSIHDLKGGNFYIWIEGSPKLNRVEEPSQYAAVEGSIYTVLGFDETPRGSMPLALLEQVRTKAQAYNKLRSYQVNHAGRFNRKYSVVKGAIGPEEMEKLETGPDGTVVEVNTLEGRPEPINDAPIAPDVYSVADIIKREITEDVGVTSYGRGTREPGVDTAFEANLIQGGADIKVQEKRDVVRGYMATVVRKLNQVLQLFADQPTVTKIVGSKGERWVQWTAEDIRGEYIFDVDIYSSMPFSEEIERKQYLEATSILMPLPELNRRKWLEKLLDVWKIPHDVLYSEAELQQMQMQQQQAMQQQQMAQAQANQMQSGQLRPTGGQVKRAPDIMAGITGPARNAQ